MKIGFYICHSNCTHSIFSELSYSHVKREGNKVAHYLAKLAVNFPESVIWMEDIPQSISSFV